MFVDTIRGVAQFGRAPRSGRGGRVFESRHSDLSVHTVSIRGVFIFHIRGPIFSQKGDVMEGYKYSKESEAYVCDERYENPLDVVVNHMVAAGISYNKIKEDLGVSDEFIEESCTPHY